MMRTIAIACFSLLSLVAKDVSSARLPSEASPEARAIGAFAPSAFNFPGGTPVDRLSRPDDSKLKTNLRKKPSDLRGKHPFLITKEDIDRDDAIVEDNIIVQSDVLRLVRPGKRSGVNSPVVYANRGPLTPLRRVTRGWNLQHVIVPRQLYYYRFRNGR